MAKPKIRMMNIMPRPAIPPAEHNSIDVVVRIYTDWSCFKWTFEEAKNYLDTMLGIKIGDNVRLLSE